VRTVIEVDIGMSRAGVAPGVPALRLASRLIELPGLEFCGVMGYEGHLLRIADPEEKRERIRAALGELVATKVMIEKAGIACPIVSCGGTGSYWHSIEVPGVTEVQAGGAVFMDAFYRHCCNVPDLAYAMTVLTTVVGRPTPDRAIIDAGRKTVHHDFHKPLVVGHDDIVVEHLSAEHGILRLEPSAHALRIGERLEMIPGYSDLTTVLHDHMFGFRQGRLEVVWPLAGRGRLQ
jgi:D-serine deaminase-like pyridoxal phosphate-dependent protein